MRKHLTLNNFNDMNYSVTSRNSELHFDAEIDLDTLYPSIELIYQ